MIKNLLFDLGGVIMDLDMQRCIDAFSALGLPDAKAYFGEYGQKGAFAALEKGIITPDEWRRDLHRLIERPVTDQQIDNAFMQFLIGIPAHRLDALLALRRRFGIYLLSNTNAVMWNNKIAHDFAQQGSNINTYFDGIVTSFEAHALKPSPQIFEFTARHLGIRPEETLFMDDSLANCTEAARLGWHSAHIAPGEEFTTVTNKL